jgi:hypothetical protein
VGVTPPKIINSKKFQNMHTDSKKNITPTDANNVLAPVLVRFTYKDSKGVMGDDLITISERDSELAIATFEKKHPYLVWREFSFV